MMNDRLPRYLTVLAIWAMFAATMVAAMAGCTSSFTPVGDINYAIPDGNGGSYGYTFYNPFREFVPDRHIPGGRRVESYEPVDPITYERPTLRPDAIIEWDDQLGSWVAR